MAEMARKQEEERIQKAIEVMIMVMGQNFLDRQYSIGFHCFQETKKKIWITHGHVLYLYVCIGGYNIVFNINN